MRPTSEYLHLVYFSDTRSGRRPCFDKLKAPSRSRGCLPWAFAAFRQARRPAATEWLLALFLAVLPWTVRAADPVPNPVFAQMAKEREQMSARAVADYALLFQDLKLPPLPTLPSPAEDPNRPANTTPVPGSRWNWSDGVDGHTIVRSGWGTWNNYDLTKADVGPLPEALVLKSGAPVNDATTWWAQRRPEILRDFETEIYGKMPPDTPTVAWETVEVDPGAEGGKAIERRIVGHIDNSRYPAAHPSIQLTVYTPADATGPVPVMVTLGGGFRFRGRTPPAGPSALEQVLARGWGYAIFNPATVQADSGGGLTEGIIGLMNRGQRRTPDQWGAIAAWSWGLSRVIDYFETDPSVDAKRLGLEGHSRWGKTVIVAAALEPRWAIVYSSCAGECGTKLHRHNLGQMVDNVCGQSEYHWMAGNFVKYAGHWTDLPIDQHELIALVAPRPVFVTGGTTDLWSDPVGEFQACVAAGPVYRLLGKRDLGTTEMPAPDHGLIEGDIAFRMHEGGHTDLPDWPIFLDFAAKYFFPKTP